MEESGVTKVISARLANPNQEPVKPSAPTPPQDDLFFVEEEVEFEEGRSLPPGVDDPSAVSAEALRPIRSRKQGEGVKATG